MPTLILSYDESIERLKSKDFRRVIATLLLQHEPNCNPTSPTASTIIFYSTKREAVDEWAELLKTEFGGEFYFVLAEITVVRDRVMRNGNKDIELEINFDNIVKDITAN